MDLEAALEILVEKMCSWTAVDFVLEISTTLEGLALSETTEVVEKLAGVGSGVLGTFRVGAGGWLDEIEGVSYAGVEVLGEVGAANFASGSDTLVDAAGLDAAGRDSMAGERSAGELVGTLCSAGGSTGAEAGFAAASGGAATAEVGEDCGAPAAGKRMPQKPATGSVNSNST